MGIPSPDMLDLSQFTFKLATFSKHQIVCLTLARSVVEPEWYHQHIASETPQPYKTPPETTKRDCYQISPQEMSQLKASPIRLKRTRGRFPLSKPSRRQKKSQLGNRNEHRKTQRGKQPQNQFHQTEGKTFTSHGIISKLPICLGFFDLNLNHSLLLLSTFFTNSFATNTPYGCAYPELKRTDFPPQPPWIH